jgi:Family of unknown function (DUF5995)
MQTINEVLTELDFIIAHCKARQSRQAYFAVLYRQMTAAVKQGIEQGQFQDGQRMEKLDVLFAKRYTDAWYAFQKKESITRSWQLAFAAAEKPLTVIQHLLLGINTHINLDLGIAAALTSPGQKIFELESDFNRINDVIAELSGSMQQKLERICWPMKMLTRIANGSEKAVLNFSIEKARKAAWANSVALALAHDDWDQHHIPAMDHTVALLGQKIIDPGSAAQWALWPIRQFETKNFEEIFKSLQ